MANLLYLVAVIVVSVIGGLIIFLRNRKPTSVEAGIDAFHRGLKALAPQRRGAGNRSNGDSRPEHRAGQGPRRRPRHRQAPCGRAGSGPPRRAAATDAQLIGQPMAAAIGAGLPIHQPLGNMVVDVGGGTTETAVISLGGIVALQALRVGSFDIDEAIQRYVRREYGIAIGERTAEEIKMSIGSAYAVDDSIKAEVRGRDMMTGLPKTVILSPAEVRDAIEEHVSAIVDSVVKCLGQAPPELAQDLILQGIHLTGGGGLLRGLDRRLSEETSLPVHLVDAPLECVVLGAGKCIEAYESLKVMFMGAAR